MDLEILINSLRNYDGITRKNFIRVATQILGETYNIGGRTALGFGDDASALNIGDDTLLLMAADGMWGKLIEGDPRWAGYCSVLANVNDIAAMGGVPLGMTNVISVNKEEICNEIMLGIKEGVQKFGIPMVGGHIHPDTPYTALDVSITGIVGKNDVITSCGATVGDSIIIGMDLDGRQHPKFPLNWDTTSHKKPELVRSQITVMNKIAKKHILTAGKDISNPGILGTLGMLLEASGVGATVELEKIPKNSKVSWDEWLKMYPGSGFVLTSKEENVKECIEMLEEVNIISKVVGIIKEDKKLNLRHENQEKVVFDFNQDLIMGIKEERFY